MVKADTMQMKKQWYSSIVGANKQIIFTYTDEKGIESDESNPNGSINNIAGICNKNVNVYGMMPHPERASENILGNADGYKLFVSLVAQELAQ